MKSQLTYLLQLLSIILLVNCQTQEPVVQQQSPANHIVYSTDIQSPSKEWIKNIQTTRRINGDRYADLQQDSEGNNYIACFVMHENRSENAYLVKTNANGEKQWEVYSSGTGNQRAYGLSVNHTEKCIWMVGFFDGEIHFGDQSAFAGGNSVFIAQFDLDGNCLQIIGGEGEAMGLNCVLDKEGNLFISGNYGSKLKIGNHQIEKKENVDQFLGKFTPEGKAQWLISLGNMHTRRMATDRVGNIYLVGSFKENFQSQAVSLMTNDYLDLDGLLLKVSPDGQLLWHEQIGNRGNERYGYRDQESISYIHIDTYDRIYIVGNIIGEYQQKGVFKSQKGENLLYTAEYNVAGQQQHFYPLAKGLTKGGVITIAMDQEENFYLSSMASDTLQFQDTLIPLGLERVSFIAKYNADFSQQKWLRRINEESDATFRSILATPYGMYAAGHYRKQFVWDSLAANADAISHELFLMRIEN